MNDKVVPNNSQVKDKKTDIEEHPRISSISNQTKSVTACNDSLKSRTLNVNVVCATCGKCLDDSNHFACVTKILNDMNARTNKPNAVHVSTRKPKKSSEQIFCNTPRKTVALEFTIQKSKSYYRMLYEKTNLVQGNITINRVYYIEGLNHNLLSVGHFCDADLEVAFWKSTCFVRDIKGNDLLTGCRISLPKLKYVEDQLCSSCKVSKAERSSFKTKTVPSSKGQLNLLHMDLCGPMRVASINGKKYIMVIVTEYSRYIWTLFLRSKDETPEVLKDFLTMIQINLQALVFFVRTDRGTEFLKKTLHAFFKEEGIEHQTSTHRTPEQNGVVKRQNHILVEAARTMLSASKLPLFFWAEAIATACYTQNKSIIIPTHEKIAYHIINDRKPSTKHLYIFGCTCYLIRDGENLDKMKEKGDPCILVGYYTQSKGYCVYNKRTRLIFESIHLRFDELKEMSDASVANDTSGLEAMDDSAWIEAMQEELHQFDRLLVWELIDKPFYKNVIKLKWRRFMLHNVDPDHPEKVYRLRKALYGLKQAPRADALQITPIKESDPFVAQPSSDAVIDYVNTLGYPCTLRNVSEHHTMADTWLMLLSINDIWMENTEKRRKPICPLKLVDEFADEGVPITEPRIDDEEADLQRGIELSLKILKQGIKGKGKEKLIDEQVEHSLLDLNTTKKKSDADQELTEINFRVQDEGHARSNPGKQDKGQAGSNLGNAVVFPPKPRHVVHAGPNLKPMDLAVSDASTQQNPEVLIHQDTSSVPPMTTPVLDLPMSQSDSLTVNAPHPTSRATTTTITTTTTLPPPPPQPQQSTTDPILLHCIGELEQHMANLIQDNLALEERLEKHGSRLYNLENLNFPQKLSKAVDEIVTDEILQQRMFKDNSYEAPDDHKNLYEALQKSLDRNYSNQLLANLDEARRKKRMKCNLPRTPYGEDLSSSKFAASTPQSMAWTTSDTRYKAADVENNWANALASNYVPPAENSLLAKTGDMTTFMSSPALSISKMKAARFPDFGLELLVPEQMWIDDVCTYELSAAYGISRWWFNRQKFYIDRHDSLSHRREVRKHMRILSVVRIKAFLRYGYDYLSEIVLPIADFQEHTIAEKDFKNLYPSDFKDLNLLLLQGHLDHLSGSDKRFEFKHDYTIIESPRAVVFQVNNNKRKIMSFNEMYKFSDGTDSRPKGSSETWNALLVVAYEILTTDCFREPNEHIISPFRSDTSTGNPVKDILLKIEST
uniref:Integrase catalytic domain-containing protein n=1 Tax=Tanacetum cinerariifolium TaxID=118510 RepID=A0A6L2MJH2_TANCI|nr:hypothetical protein [Tanacetum cinerariifolium]